MFNHTAPVIELLASGDTRFFDQAYVAQIHERCDIAAKILGYFQPNNDGSLAGKDSYYLAVSQLLKSTEYKRVLLYLPLSDLADAPRYFQDTYLDAWYHLLAVQDARENFFEGDTFEMDARPKGELERVVKCAHLSPWLLKAGYISYYDIREILLSGLDNEVLLRSFANTWQIIDDRHLLSSAQVSKLRSMTAHVSQRAKLEPTYNSEKRQIWLRQKGDQLKRHKVLVTPNADLSGPFSPNLSSMDNELVAVQKILATDKMAIIGGSRLKGYGTEDSDLDIFDPEELAKIPTMRSGSPHAAHIYFNMVWVGSCEVKNLTEAALAKAKAYFGSRERLMSIERIESDLLQYRLLHKGFRLFHNGFHSMASGYPDMDGDCPYYDDSYRRIATQLFAKYVFIPA